MGRASVRGSGITSPSVEADSLEPGRLPPRTGVQERERRYGASAYRSRIAQDCAKSVVPKPAAAPTRTKKAAKRS